MDRLIDCLGASSLGMSATELVESIRLSEGRSVVSEIICPQMPMLYDISNVELAASFGADLLLLNLYDVNQPFVRGLPTVEGLSVIETIKKFTSRYVGVNLEPVDPLLGRDDSINKGRVATLTNVEKLIDQGADFLVLTGNPGVGVSHKSIVSCISSIKDRFGDSIAIIAGRMHASGDPNAIGRSIINGELINDFISVGVDIMLLPAPGTVPGITREMLGDYIEQCHGSGKLVMTTIGTSQEGADTDTIKRIAYYSKEAGSDLHHIGDCGYGPGIAVPENIMAYSIAIKGRRHTYRRMAASINR